MAAHATLDRELLISYTRVALVDTITCQQDSEGEVIVVSEMCELPTKTHDILDNAMKKWVGDMACIVAHFLILLSCIVLKFGLHSFPFFTVSVKQFLLVRLAFMVVYTEFWYRLSNSLSWACFSLFLL